MVNETKTFLAILDKNKDLAFNPEIDGYTPDLTKIDFIKNSPTEKIKKLRHKLITDGGLYLHKPNQKDISSAEFNEAEKFEYSEYSDLSKVDISKFIDAFKANKTNLKEEEWALGYSAFRTTEAIGPVRIFCLSG
nr:hypothetical protein [Mycoplasmopsis bovis]